MSTLLNPKQSKDASNAAKRTINIVFNGDAPQILEQIKRFRDELNNVFDSPEFEQKIIGIVKKISENKRNIMPRSISPTLESLLPLCETQSTVEILLRGDDEPYLLATAPLDIETKGEYEKGLLKVGEFKETFGQATNRIGITLSNVNQEWGLHLADNERKLEFAGVNVGRFYRDADDLETNEHVHFFTGKAVGAGSDEQTLSFDVITPETAAGTCIAIETLSPTNGWRYPRTQSPPGSAGNDGGIGGGDCPRVDQFVLARDENGNIEPLRAGLVNPKTWLWNPVLKIFQPVKSSEIVENQPIWEVRNELGAQGFCSPTHPLVRTIGDTKGEAVQNLSRGNVSLAWLDNDIKRARLTQVRDTGMRSPVVRIEMETGHIYAFGASEIMYVCHNAQNKNNTILT